MFPNRVQMLRCLSFRALRVAALVVFCVAVRAEERVAREAMRVLQGQCLSCHNAEKHKGGLDMTSREKLFAGAENGAVIDTNKMAASLLLKVLEPEADPHMPPKKQLSTNQIAVLTKWITAGAPWDSAALAEAAAPRTVKLGELPKSLQPNFAIAMSPDGKRLAFSRGNRILLHDLGTNFPLVASVEAHSDLVRSLAWSANGKTLASGGYKEVRLWDGATLEKRGELAAGLNGQITAIRFTRHGGALVVADSVPAESGWLRVFRLGDDKKEIAAWRAHDDLVHDLALSADGGFLATAGGDKMVRLWELISQKEVGRIEAHSDAVMGVALNTNATQLLTVSTDKELKLWDVATGLSAVTIGPRGYGFTAVAWSADNKTAVATSDKGQVVRFANFKIHTGAQSSETAEERVLRDTSEPLHCVSITEDGSRFAAGGHDGKVYLLDREGKVLHTFSPEGTTAPDPQSPSFVRDVLPVMAKAGCMAGACHAKAEGQNGFKLSVFSFDPKADYHEIVKDARGRRVFAAAPEESLLLLKPTGAIEHGGGQRIEPGSETYKTLVAWIRGGMAYQHTNEATLARVSVEPSNRTYQKGATQQLKLTAHYSDGSTRDVTHLADFVSSDKEIAKVSEDGAVSVGTVEGEGVMVARYMGFVDASHITIPASRTLPAEKYAALPANNYIDRLAYARFKELGLFPSDLCTDAEFIRRSSLDAIGVLPSSEQVRQFLADTDSGKRRRWIEYLLDHPAYADAWANKWTDLMRPNPDRVGVKSIYFLDQWIRDAFRKNKPYDQFVREILLAEGSNHQDGPATIYRDRREPQDRTTLVTQLFLGVRMECAKCHHHPTEKWKQDDFYQFAAFFGPVKQKGAGLSPPISAGRETFFFAAGGAVKHPVTDAVMKPRPLDTPNLNVPESEDPRRALADWITNPDNPFFAKAAVNRIWGAFFGRGFAEPVDDFRISNPVMHEELLNALAADFVKHGYDLKHIMRTVMNSRLYQLSATPNEYNLTDTKNFSRSYRRRLPAEVLLDAVNDVTGTQDEFNGCPPGTRAIQTWSYKVRSHFMDAFGRPNASTDCPCERDMKSSVVQSLHMMNSRALQDKLASGECRVKRLADSKAAPEEIITELYLSALSRLPTSEELQIALLPYSAEKATRQSATEDVLWALLNSPEFVFNH
jgi:WD40 repeat protein